MSEIDNTEIQRDLTPKKIAFIVDGKVMDILQTDERLAAIFLSQPQIVDITDGYDSSLISLGHIYSQELEKFIPEKPFPSWILNSESNNWKPPIDFPTGYSDDYDFYYSWNEEVVNWEQVPKPLLNEE
jgi:hypothetical protein